MGSCELHQGDCLTLMQDIPDQSIDMILCDLPYGITARNPWDTPLPFDKLWGQYTRIITPNGCIVLFASGMFTANLMQSNPRMWRYNLVWQKTSPSGFLNANRMPLRGHEDICIFYKRLPTYNPQKTTGHPRKVSTAVHKRASKQSTNYAIVPAHTYDSTERFPTSVLTFATDKQKAALHPTQKPVTLLEWLILTYTNPGDLVLDNCMGSGSTGIAALNTGRKFIGIELDEAYFQIASDRIQKRKEELCNQIEKGLQNGCPA